MENAGEAFWERGLEYAWSNRVKEIVASDDDLAALVIGTRIYHVTFEVMPDGTLDYDCTCPAIDNYGFCKHLVAVAVTWINDINGVVRKKDGRELDEALAEATGEYLATLPAAELAGMVAGRMAADTMFRAEMILRLAGADPSIAEEVRAQFRKSVRDVRPNKYQVGHVASPAFAPLPALWESITTRSNADIMIEMCEMAMAAIALIFGRSASSTERIEQAASLRRAHRTACDLARLTRAKRSERESTFDLFCPELPDDEQEEEKPGRKTKRSAERSDPPARWRLERMALERVGIDPREWYDVDYCRALASGYYPDPHTLIRTYMVRGDYGSAIDRSLALLAQRPHDETARRTLTEAITESGRSIDPILKGQWKEFGSSFSQEIWETIHMIAEPAGLLQTCRDRAVRMVEKEMATHRPHHGATGSLLVVIHLSSGDPVAAWNAALEHDCSAGQWLRIADALVDVAPDDAAAIWQERIESEIERKTAQAYDEAVELLRKVEPAMAAAGRDADFTEYLGALLDANKMKKALCGKLRALWPERCAMAERGNAKERREK